jgi:hypothetical protein
MLVHHTEKDGKPVSVTLEQEPTELRGLWARAAAAYIQAHFPSLSLAKLLKGSISTAGPRAATHTIRLEFLGEPEDVDLLGMPPAASGGPARE